jgi:hypothetical protein
MVKSRKHKTKGGWWPWPKPAVEQINPCNDLAKQTNTNVIDDIKWITTFDNYKKQITDCKSSNPSLTFNNSIEGVSKELNEQKAREQVKKAEARVKANQDAENAAINKVVEQKLAAYKKELQQQQVNPKDLDTKMAAYNKKLIEDIIKNPHIYHLYDGGTSRTKRIYKKSKKTKSRKRSIKRRMNK